MNEIQVQDILNKLKEQIGELTYQLIYRDVVIEALQKELEDMQRQFEQAEHVEAEIMN